MKYMDLQQLIKKLNEVQARFNSVQGVKVTANHAPVKDLEIIEKDGDYTVNMIF